MFLLNCKPFYKEDFCPISKYLCLEVLIHLRLASSKRNFSLEKESGI